MKIASVSGKFSVECEIAKTPWKQAVGLGFSGKRRNMLFLMGCERRWEFWMLGMLYPLKIIFIDSRKCVIEVLDAEPLSLNPKTWKLYVPRKKCEYILEIPAGSGYDFKEGDRLKW